MGDAINLMDFDQVMPEQRINSFEIGDNNIEYCNIEDQEMVCENNSIPLFDSNDDNCEISLDHLVQANAV